MQRTIFFMADLKSCVLRVLGNRAIAKRRWRPGSSSGKDLPGGCTLSGEARPGDLFYEM